MKNIPLQGIAQLLVHNHILDETTALAHQQDAYDQNIDLLHYWVSHQIIAPDVIASTIATHFDLPRFELDNIDIASISSTWVNEHFIQRHQVVPLFLKGNQLHVAIDYPDRHEALKEIQFHTGFHVLPVVVETHKLTRLINQILHRNEHQGLSNLIQATESDRECLTDSCGEDPPVVRFVNRIIREAIEQGASDIHFEPYEHTYRIRYRQDGLLMTMESPPQSLSARIAARIKILSGLDISERRIPQDGRFSFSIPSSVIDCRVSTCPTISGEKIVIRILNTPSIQPNIETIGLTPQQKKHVLDALSRPQGMILVTGPTGSGKTMTLYAALNHLNTSEKNISTVENPVEITLHGINQVNINLKAGLTFAKALRAFLRQDPDVIMLGEIRDLETADMAVKAAQTGHLVLSTLHTNSAVETLTRLINLGVPAFNLSGAIRLIVAQRLVRRLCTACKIIRTDLSHDTQAPLFHTHQVSNCNQCNQGYRGRVALFEVMPISQGLAQRMMNGSSSEELLAFAKSEGMITLFDAGLELVNKGITSLEELTRVVVE